MQGRLGKRPEFAGVFESLLSAAQKGVAAFPLSSSHYMETWNRGDYESRRQLADTLMALARPRGDARPLTIASPPEITPTEIDWALRKRFGRPKEPRHYEVFGEGLGHAFGKRDLGASLRVKTKNIIAELEFQGLLGSDRSGPPHGYGHIADRFIKSENDLIAEFNRLALGKAGRDAYLAIRSFYDLKDEFFMAIARAGLTEEAVPDTSEGQIEFIESLPTRNVDYQLHRLRFDNPQLKREEGDLVDFAFLSVAVVHCDVVVTEKQWVDLIQRSGLDELHSTTMLRGLTDLVNMLD